MHRIERHAPLFAGLLFAIPVLLVKFPPMDDLPLHEATIGLLRHWGDPRLTPHSLYFINLGHANQLFSLVVFGLSLIFPIAWAAKMGVALTLVALALGASHFADHVDAPRWTALLVLPIGLGWLFYWGLVQNILGIALFLALLPSIDRFALHPTRRGALEIACAMVLLHFAHESAQLLACAAVVCCALGLRQDPKSAALRAAPLVFSLALAYAAQRYAWHFANHAQIASVFTVYTPLSTKLFEMSGVLFGGYEPVLRHLVMLLALVPVLLFASGRMQTPARREPAMAAQNPSGAPRQANGSWSAAAYGWRFEILALVLILVYLVAPARIKVTTLVYHRFLPPAWAILAIASAAGTRATAKILPRVLCAALPLASLLVALPAFADSQRVYSDLDAIMAYMDPGSTVLSASFTANASSRLWNPAILACHVVAAHGGRAVNDYTLSPISILSQRAEKQWIEPHQRLRKRHFDFRPTWDLTRFRYLILETDSLALPRALSTALRGTARFVASQGDVYLYESTLPLVPIDADDAPLPDPPPATLAALLEAHEKAPLSISAPEEPGPTP